MIKLSRKKKKSRLLNQFTRFDGPKGNSSQYQQGWERIFGKRSKARR